MGILIVLVSVFLFSGSTAASSWCQNGQTDAQISTLENIPCLLDNSAVVFGSRYGVMADALYLSSVANRQPGVVMTAPFQADEYRKLLEVAPRYGVRVWVLTPHQETLLNVFPTPVSRN